MHDTVSPITHQPTKRKTSFWFLLLVLTVLLAGYAVRTLSLTDYPPGISFDEAIEMLDGVRLVQSGNYPLYEDIDRPEPLSRLFLALANGTFGAQVWLNRYAYVLLGVLTLALAYWATTQALRDAPHNIRRWAGMFALLTLALALGHITLSRSLYRGMLQVPLMLLTFGFLARGLALLESASARHVWRSFAYAGLALGASISTYTAAYVTPLATIPLVFALLVFRRASWRRWLPMLVLTAGVALLVMLPFVLQILTNANAIFARATDVEGGRGVTLSLSMVERMLGQILVAGDQNPQYNVTTAPMMPVQLSALFWLGLGALAIRLRQPMSLFLLTWLVLASLTPLLSGEFPHGLRSVGLFAVLPLMAGIGVGSSLLLLRRWGQQIALMGKIGAFACVLLALIQVPNVLHTYQDYWGNAQNWRLWDVHGKTLNHNEWFFRTDRQSLAEWMLAQDTPLLVPRAEFDQAFLQAWLIAEYPQVRSADAMMPLPTQTQVILPYSLALDDFLISPQFVLLHEGVMYILPPYDADTLQTIAQSEGDIISNTGNIPQLAKVFPLTFEPRYTTYHTLADTSEDAPFVFDGDVALVGWYGDDELLAEGGRVDIGLEWQPLRRLGHDYVTYVQIQNQDQTRLAGVDQRSLRWVYPTFNWSPDEDVVDHYALDVPALDVGAYRLIVGMYPNFGEDVAITRYGEDIGTQATVAWLKVAPDENVTLPDALIEDTPIFGDAIVLQAIVLSPVPAETNADSNADTYDVQLYWQTHVHRPDFDATIFVHALDAEGNIIAQDDTRPKGGQYPTFIWDDGEVVQTQHRLTLPLDSTPETISLRLGMYIFTPEPQNLPVIVDGQNDGTGAYWAGMWESFLR